jgi:nucleoside diphosphate kinase
MAGPSTTVESATGTSGPAVAVSVNADGKESNAQQTITVIKPDGMLPAVLEQIVETIKRNRFDIVRMRKVWLTKEVATEFYKEHETQPYFGKLIAYMTSAPVLALVLSKENAVKAWREIMGPGNSKRAKDEAPKRYADPLCHVPIPTIVQFTSPVWHRRTAQRRARSRLTRARCP